MATPAGLLLVDKPVGPTSFDLVAQVRRKLLIKKVGHCGTLDPAASGLMLICVGAATRLVPYLTAAEKAYRGTLLLGVATNSYDAEGEVTGEDSAEAVEARVRVRHRERGVHRGCRPSSCRRSRRSRLR